MLYGEVLRAARCSTRRDRTIQNHAALLLFRQNTLSSTTKRAIKSLGVSTDGWCQAQKYAAFRQSPPQNVPHLLEARAFGNVFLLKERGRTGIDGHLKLDDAWNSKERWESKTTSLSTAKSLDTKLSRPGNLRQSVLQKDNISNQTSSDLTNLP